MNFAAIPETLRNSPQWVCWMVEDRDGKPTKVPVRAGSHLLASATDASTWASFDAVVGGMNGHAGIGWVVTDSTGIVLIDFDDVRNPNTGALTPWVQKILDRIPSYAEVSPSGTGLHIVVKGALPAGARKRGCCEMYDSRRFFAFTGDHLEGKPSTVEPVNIAWLHRLMSADAFNFDRNPKLEELLNGTDQDESVGDLSFCSILAHRGLNHDEIDAAVRVFRYREKWDERRNESTYGRDTILKALKGKISTPPPVKPESLLVTKEGVPRACVENALLLLRHSPEWQSVLAHCEFTQRTIMRKLAPGFPDLKSCPRDWVDNDDTLTTAWLQRNGVLLNSVNTVAQAVQTVARENSFHPVRDYLQSLTWDGTERLAYWLHVCAGAPDDDYTEQVARRSLIAGCARIFEPGAKADCVPILIGKQGILKSTLLKTLAVRDEWFTDHGSDLATKDSRLELAGVWIVELSELAAVRRSEVERVKSFLSTSVDAYRPPYGRRVERFPRQCIFFATSNSSEILNDSTGARRFWPVRCEKIDIDAMRAYRTQLWAEAVSAYKAGQPWWFDSADLERAAQVERDRHYERGPRYEIIATWIQSPAKREKFRQWEEEDHLPWAGSAAGKINATDVCIHGLGLDVKEIKPQDYTEVTNTLRHLGYESVLENSGAHRGRRYWRK
jgi:hypothetical protein